MRKIRKLWFRPSGTIFQDYCQANGKISRETALQIMEQTDLQKMVDQIAVNIPVFYEEKQKLLEAVDLTERFEQLSVLLENEIQVMNIKTEIQEKVKARVDKNQREYILREQLKVIREELGEDTTEPRQIISRRRQISWRLPTR